MRWIAAALSLLIVVALLWVGGELHYRNCVNTASDRVTASDTQADEVRAQLLGLPTPRERQLQELRRGCSRLPF